MITKDKQPADVPTKKPAKMLINAEKQEVQNERAVVSLHVSAARWRPFPRVFCREEGGQSPFLPLPLYFWQQGKGDRQWLLLANFVVINSR